MILMFPLWPQAVIMKEESVPREALETVDACRLFFIQILLLDQI